MKRIYLDHNATTAVDERVIEAIIRELRSGCGNPSSSHFFGQRARNTLLTARTSIAEALGVAPQELFFTSGGTEAINLLLKGFFVKHPSGHVITSDLEHAAVYNTLQLLQKRGWDVTFLSPVSWGAATADQVKEALRSDTCLIALMAVNNETGVKTDVEAIAQVAQEADIPFFVDGVAWLGKELFTIPPGISAMCFSGHKIHAPKGVGLAWCRKSFKVEPLISGGNQEHGRRAGTENLPGIVGLAEAIKLLNGELPAATERMQQLRDRLEKGILTNLSDVSVNGKGPRICNTTSMAFANVDGESLLMNLDLEGVAVSLGAACHSGGIEPSRIILNMGIPPELANASVRFSLSRQTTQEDIDATVDIVTHVVTRLRN